MIGRGAVGNPWIFARRERESIPPGEVRAMIHLHLQRNMEFYGPRKGYILFRKHANRYLWLQGLPHQQRIELITREDAATFLVGLEETFAALEKQAAA